MATVQERIATVKSVDEHPHVRKHEQFAAMNDELSDLLGRSPARGLLAFPYPSAGFAFWASQIERLEGR